MPRRRTLAVALMAAAVATAAQAGRAFAESRPMTNQDWWPERLDLRPLRQHAAESSPMGEDFDYAAA